MTTTIALPPASVGPVSTVNRDTGGQTSDEESNEHDFGDVLATIALVASTVHTRSQVVDPGTPPMDVTASADAGEARHIATADGTNTAPASVLDASSPQGGVSPATADTLTEAPPADMSRHLRPVNRLGLALASISLAGVDPSGAEAAAAAPPTATPGPVVDGLAVATPEPELDVGVPGGRHALDDGIEASVATDADDVASIETAETDTGSSDQDGASDTRSQPRDTAPRPLPPHAGSTGATQSAGATEVSVSIGAEHGDAVAGRVVRPAPIDGAARLGVPNSISVDLGDEGLGSLVVTATADRGAVNLVVNAGEERTRDAILQQRADLLDDLESAGVRLGTLDINARDDDRGADPGANGRPRDRHDDTTDPEPTRPRPLVDANRLDLHI